MKNLKDQTKKMTLRLVLALSLTLISFPAISMIDDTYRAGITDDCVGCGLCVSNFPDSFYLDDDGLANIFPDCSPEDVKTAQADCPYDAIMTSW